MNIISLALIHGMYGLLHITGLFLALMFWRRCPKACALLFTASILNILVTAARVGLQFFWVDMVFFGYAMAITSIAQWIAYGLLLVAVFAGRNDERPREARPTRPWPDDDDWRTPTPKSPADSTGIQAPR
jgi:hypothetical protein